MILTRLLHRPQWQEYFAQCFTWNPIPHYQRPPTPLTRESAAPTVL